MNLEPRIHLRPVMRGEIRMWVTSCLDCGYTTGALHVKRAELVRRVHRHRHIMGLVYV